MTVEIIIRTIFLVFIAGLGWVAGSVLKIRATDVSALLVHVISPFVIFLSILQSPADWTCFVYSIGALAAASIAAAAAYAVARMAWKDARVNLFSFAGGTGNTGYFALPLVFALFDPSQVVIAVFIIIGVNLYEFTVGYFIAARGMLDTRHSLRRIVRLPILYAAVAGLTFKLAGLQLGEAIVSSLSNFKGAYSVLGMMTIGLTLAGYRKITLDWPFLLAMIGWKHIVHPLVGSLVFGLLDVPAQTLAVIALMLATPMAGNIVMIANDLGVHPEKAALSVMVSTLLAIVTVPLAVAWVQG